MGLYNIIRPIQHLFYQRFCSFQYQPVVACQPTLATFAGIVGLCDPGDWGITQFPVFPAAMVRAQSLSIMVIPAMGTF